MTLQRNSKPDESREPRGERMGELAAGAITAGAIALLILALLSLMPQAGLAQDAPPAIEPAAEQAAQTEPAPAAIAAPVAGNGPAATGVAANAVPGALDRAFTQIGGNQASGGGDGLTLSLQLLLLMGLLTILPALILMMTSFTRIIVVLAILRQALGLQQSPPNQVLIGLSLFLSLFVMAPTLEQVNDRAIAPYAAGAMNAEQAIEVAGDEFHRFMMRQTRKTDLAMFANIAKAPKFKSPQDVPFSILLPAFVTSELKTAFQIGFLLFLPFLVIDLVVSSVLMSLGMMMMSPMLVSLPFKLLLFVLVDGWALLMGSLAASFN